MQFDIWIFVLWENIIRIIHGATLIIIIDIVRGVAESGIVWELCKQLYLPNTTFRHFTVPNDMYINATLQFRNNIKCAVATNSMINPLSVFRKREDDICYYVYWTNTIISVYTWYDIRYPFWQTEFTCWLCFPEARIWIEGNTSVIVYCLDDNISSKQYGNIEGSGMGADIPMIVWCFALSSLNLLHALSFTWRPFPKCNRHWDPCGDIYASTVKYNSTGLLMV